ncbi:MAG: trehalose-phosphatase [Actinobacteria bacterium]|nr:trehalose-phosphatase [Actinomycetota bacterium]
MTTGHQGVWSDSPEMTGLFLDFDGTLSEIVDDPSDARPLTGIPPEMTRLSRRLGLVAVVSGRTAQELLEWFGPDVELWGLYGAERSIDGTISVSDDLATYEPLIKTVLQQAERRAESLGIEGLLVEDKGYMVGLHWRKAPDRTRAAEAMTSLADELTAEHDLVQAPGKCALELRPPVEWSKGDVVSARTNSAGLEGAAFVGDDRGDLPAFDALDRLEEEGLSTIKVGVRSLESPPELLRRADVIVDGPTGVLRWLRDLAG